MKTLAGNILSRNTSFLMAERWKEYQKSFTFSSLLCFSQAGQSSQLLLQMNNTNSVALLFTPCGARFKGIPDQALIYLNMPGLEVKWNAV